MSTGRPSRTLLFIGTVSSATCAAELIWLRSADLAATPLTVGLLFLPWFVAAAVNLGVWHSMLEPDPSTPWQRTSKALFTILRAAFAIAFVTLYGALLLGWPRSL